MKLFVKLCALVMALALMLGGAALAESKNYIVGTNPEFPPFEYVNDQGEVAGIDVDIINAIIGAMDPTATVSIESMDFDALIPALASGKVDIVIAGMTATDERRQSVLFTDPYYDATQKIIVPVEGATVTCEADLEGKKIGVQLGTTGDLYVTDNFPTADVQRFNKGMDAVQDLISGRLDAVVIDSAPAAVFVSQTEGLTLLEDNLSEEVYAIALPLEDTELCEQMNAALATLKEDGSLQAIIDSYNSSDAEETAAEETETVETETGETEAAEAE